jgi:hypothetical protein
MLTVSFARIKPDKERRLRDWLIELGERQDEVRLSLAQEGARQEQMYILPSSDGPILVYVMEAEDVRRAYSAYGASSLPIDESHRMVLAEVLAEPLHLEPQYSCSRA